MRTKQLEINKKRVYIVVLFIVFRLFGCYGENCNIVTFTPLKNNDTTAIESFLKGDTLSFKKIERITDTRTKCFYESEFFMYSLVMALQFNDTSAFSQMTESINRFYRENNLEKGNFSNDLIKIFQDKCSDVLNDNRLDTFCTSLFNYNDLQINYRRQFLLNDTLKCVLYEGNKSLYKKQLYSLLKNNCGRFNKQDPYTYFYSDSHMLFLFNLLRR